MESPLDESPIKTLDLTTPYLFPSCAVTRSRKNKNKYSHVAPTTFLPSEGLYDNMISEDNLILAQQQESSLIKIRDVATEVKDLNKSPCFYYQDGVLMRAYRQAP